MASSNTKRKIKKVTIKTIKIIVAVLLFYSLYFIVSFAVVFSFDKVTPSDKLYDKEDILSTSSDSLYAHLIDNHQDALNVRLAMIEAATTNINLMTYLYHGGFAGDIITGALLKRADEGIKIQIVVDGKGPIKNTNYKLLSAHDNIDYYLFEPFSVLLPHTINNFQHNKLLTVDDQYGLIGGRNISDRFLYEDNDYLTYDNDVLIYGYDTIKPVLDMNKLIENTIDYKHTKKVNIKKISRYEITKLNLINDYINYYDSGYKTINNYRTLGTKVDNITFVESPLTRLNKDPIVARTIFDLIDENDKVIIQSPYITTSTIMKERFDTIEDYYNNEFTFLTNNINQNPNFFGLSGYLRIRKKLALNSSVYEYQGEGSIHGKTISIGNNISVIGSLNMDSRSFFLSTESVVIIVGENFNAKLKQSVNNIINQSLLVDIDNTYIGSEIVEEAEPRKFRTTMAKIASYLVGAIEHLI